jgi:5'-nucleotidase/UDP-sugar diphosphatase
LYSLTCPLMVGQFIVAIPKYTKGKLQLVAKNRKGQPLKSRVEALEDPHTDPLDNENPYLLPPPGKLDRKSVAIVGKSKAGKEIKEWQAIMDHLRNLPSKKKGELPVIPVDERAAEVRAIKEG